jgi:hypothetical protein
VRVFGARWRALAVRSVPRLALGRRQIERWQPGFGALALEHFLAIHSH